MKLTKAQEETLHAIADTCIASLSRQEEDMLVRRLSGTGHSREEIQAFSQLSVSSLQAHQDIMHFIDTYIAPDKQADFIRILGYLSTRVGTFMLTRHWCEFRLLTRSQREQAMLDWKNSKSPNLRLLYKMLSVLSVAPIYRVPDSPVHSYMRCPNQDPMRSAPEYKANNASTRYLMMTTEDVMDGMRFDAIVVGSGAGGGVCAAELSKAGMKVLVIERGKYYHESEFDTRESIAYANMYDSMGPITTTDGVMSMLAGNTFGGGTTVNWSVSLKPPHFVREEWANEGLSHFLSQKFSNDIEKVIQRIGASTAGIKHNRMNQILIDGCNKLGYPVEDIPQNTGGQPHECHWCFAGCKDAIKNGTVNTWLRDAESAGAKFLDESVVQRILIERGKAIGVECHVHGKKTVSIYADRVIVAAGSLNTPGILLNSGLKNKHIGHHLRLHPSVLVFGFFDEPVNPSEGSIMTAVSNVAEYVNGSTYGVKLETPCLTAGNYSSLLPWRGSLQHKEAMLKYNHASCICVIARDKDSISSVKYTKAGNREIYLKLSNHDQKSLLTGLERAIKIMCAAGAREIHTGQYGVDPFVFKVDEVPSIDNPRFIQWLKEVHKYGIPLHGAGIFGAHQMGSCRMGISPKVSVTKPTGETWEVKGLYLGDTSIFPTATGVNPMVTTEAVALHVADSIVRSQTSISNL
ncbi:hypothetical protein EC973_007778 [Apophysomyces ossiformis]|uniref:Long-chain-alcohol oxidase n=1 Tax=Apophysomyces ossiformis TaxID=679940 RepID=A0A8H7BVH0_9FUNG|nr:hypothetical protein EC973_007778 [Apophysomyces ossiformis]